MRRIAIILGATLIGALTMFVGTSAHAQTNCPGEDGLLPGSSPSVTPIGPDDGTNLRTIFVDDRQFHDWDDDDDAGGLWVYIETNSTPGLTRGGDQVAFNFFNPQVPRVEPLPILPPDPNRPVFANGITLFPNGLGGGSLSELVGFHDDCKEFGGEGQPATADSILF